MDTEDLYNFLSEDIDGPFTDIDGVYYNDNYIDLVLLEQASSSMETISILTQRTLSAFHKAGVDADLHRTISNLKLHLKDRKTIEPRRLITFRPSKQKGYVIRIFKDGYLDEVPLSQASIDSYPIPQDMSEDDIHRASRLDKILKDSTYNPSYISTIKNSVKDSTSRGWVNISKPSETLFFLNYDD